MSALPSIVESVRGRIQFGLAMVIVVLAVVTAVLLEILERLSQYVQYCWDSRFWESIAALSILALGWTAIAGPSRLPSVALAIGLGIICFLAMKFMERHSG